MLCFYQKRLKAQQCPQFIINKEVKFVNRKEAEADKGKKEARLL